MESLLFILSCVAMVVLCFMSMRDDRRSAGEANTSWFRCRGENATSVPVDRSEERLRKLQKKYAR